MKKYILSSFLCIYLFPAVAQDKTPGSTTTISPAAPSPGIRIKLNEEGSQYLKMNIWMQTWFRAIDNNPGTAVNGDPQQTSIDAGIRRMRIQMFGQLSPRFLLMLQMGINNQSFATGGGSGTGASGAGKKAPFFFHDAYGQFTIIPEKNAISHRANKVTLDVGTGLHSWNGVSRLSNASTISLLTTDAPVFNWPTVEIADQFTRQFGIFAKGHAGRLAYRLSINKPFMTSLTPAVGAAAVDNNRGNQVATQGYFAWEFRDREEIPNAFYAGSYYGSKKVLNIGAGFLRTPHGTMSQPVKDLYESHTITALGVDLFYDAPLGNRSKDMAVTIYSVYYHYDFGPGYLRSSGIMNAGTADTSYKGAKALEGYGNSRILMGTGNLFYTQSAILLPRFSSKLRIQPYVSYSYKDLEALNQPGHYYNAGANFLFDGNRAKVSLEYGSRPLYSTTDKKIFKRAGEILACIQFWL